MVADFGIEIHAGQGAVDVAPGPSPRRLVGAGDVFDAIEFLRAVHTGQGPPTIVVSAIVLEQAGMTLDTFSWQSVPAPEAGATLRVTTLTADA